jgi:ATP-dependent Clp protease ATP-binding subunit ClpB
VGYDEGGQLTEAVRHKPYSVILFDEIEKAHPDVFNVLLQVLDDGRLTDNKGRVVNFKNTIIIMTSNLGSHLIHEKLAHVNEENMGMAMEQTREELLDLLQRTIRPEFLNRVDDIIVFTPLTRSDVRHIVKLQFERITERMQRNDFSLKITDAAVDWIATVGFDPAYGARPVKRLLQKYVLNELSKKILAGSLESGKAIWVDLKNDELFFRN